MVSLPFNKFARLGLLLACACVFVAGLVFAPAAAQEGGPTPPLNERPTALHSLYLPLVARARIMVNGDLLIDTLEPTQAIQNPSNRVPMIAGKATVLRIYAHTTGAAALKGLPMTVRATRNGVALAGSPLTVSTAVAPVGWTRGDLASSTNLNLPAAWLTTGKVDLTITLDPADQYAETNETNNSLSMTLNFIAVPTLEVKVVPIQYYDPPSGIAFPAPKTDFVAAGLLRMYPVGLVNVVVRKAVSYGRGGQDLGDSRAWDQLLNLMTDLKRTDAAPDYQVYYGLLASKDDKGTSWFNGGVAGMSWISNRVSTGMDDAEVPGWHFTGENIAAHEIGHTLGRPHSPCGLPAGTDRNYPYKTGSIGQYGLNVLKMQVYSPDVYSDIMGYCQTQWVSDYTYIQWYYDQAKYGGPQNDARPEAGLLSPGLLVRASVNPDGSLDMRPFYQFAGRLSAPTESPAYRLDYLDEQGGVIASFPLAELHAEAEGYETRAINALAPLPDRPYAAVRISRLEAGSETALAEKPFSAQTLARPAAPAIFEEGSQATLRWGDEQTPALVRYSTDGGQSWTTLTLDALGGQFSLAQSELPAGTLLFEVVLADSRAAAYRLEWQAQP